MLTETLKQSNINSNSIFKKLVLQAFSKIKNAAITVIDGTASSIYGDRSSQLQATIVILDANFYRRIAIAGSIGFAESFMAGFWETDNLTNLIRIFAQNISTVDQADNKIKQLFGNSIGIISHLLNRNSYRGSRLNISRHYDLGNDFFQLFLDKTMMYSCAIFEQTDDLHQAQLNKLREICERLELKSSDHVMEIGSGWGGFAIYAAQNYGCKITTTTISQQQYIYVKQKIQQLGLEDKITVLNEDYRSLQGQYDKLVSIEMIEAVGIEYFTQYFKTCSNLLKDHGMFLLQAITIVDQRYLQAAKEVDFIKKHIFPGGCLPSVSSIMQNVAIDTDFSLQSLKNISFDYAKTLKSWYDLFKASQVQLGQMGFNSSFIRKWHYYFCYCEAGFLERNVFAYQFCLTKPKYRPNLDYNI